MAPSRYARIYFDDIEGDPKFEGIRHRHDYMGAYQLVLCQAEKAWPASAFQLPKSWVPGRYFALFVERRIVDLEPDGRYRVHGLDAERRGRSDRAKDAADKRWSGNAVSNAAGTTDAVPVAMPRTRAPVVSSASVSPSFPEGGVGGDDGRADLEAFLVVNYRPPTPKQRVLMDAYCRVFDQTGPERAARLILSHPDDPIGAIKADLDAFRRERSTAAKAQEVPKPIRRKGSGLTGINAELAQLLRDQDARRDLDDTNGGNAA